MSIPVLTDVDLAEIEAMIQEIPAYNLAGILTDDMGLGRTLQVAVLCCLDLPAAKAWAALGIRK